MEDRGQSPDRDCWRIDGQPAVIEYSAEALQTIVRDVEAAFRMFPHGGLAVGGVLFGEAGEDRIRIVTSRSIHCDHSAGPSFTLSDEDHRKLEEQLRQAAEDPHLDGLVPVGWYHSHTRSGVNLTPSDLELHERHFPNPWQIALVLRPEEERPTQLGIFARDASGRLPAHPALLVELPRLEKPPHVELRPAVEDKAPHRHEGQEAEAAPEREEGEQPVEQPVRAPSFQFGGGETPKGRGGWKNWVIAAGAGVALLAGFWFAAQSGGSASGQAGLKPAIQSVSAYLQRVRQYWGERLGTGGGLRLGIVASGSSLLIRWDPSNPEFRGAAGGAIKITDGPNVTEVSLDLMELMQGAYTYAPLTDDVRVELAIQRMGAPPVVVASRYLRGGVRAPSDGAPQATPEELRLEVERLRSAVALEREQVATLTRTLTVLQEFEQRQAAARVSPAARPGTASPAGGPGAGTETAPAAAVGAAPAPRAAPRVELAQNPPAIGFEQRGAAITATGTPPARSVPEPAPAPRAGGPTSGKLIWTGFLRAGETLTIDGGRASTGNVTGRLPAVPVEISIYPAEFTSSGLTVYTTDQPVPSGGGARAGLNFQYEPAKAAAVSLIERPSEANQWRRLRVRAGDRPVPAIVIIWRRSR